MGVRAKAFFTGQLTTPKRALANDRDRCQTGSNKRYHFPPKAGSGIWTCQKITKTKYARQILKKRIFTEISVSAYLGSIWRTKYAKSVLVGNSVKENHCV